VLPGFKAFRIYKGDTFAFNLTLGAGGVDYIITGHTFTGQIKEKGKSTKVAEFTAAITNATAGELTVTLPASESAKLNGLKIYEYDIQMVNSGVVSTILKGPITVVSDITN
jgi:type V secretory pathway adhesin AidA